MEEKSLKIGKYKIRSKVGEGAAGIVYEGYDPDIQRRVAIKILHPHLMHGKLGEELLARFKREAISAAKCNHPNVVSILEYGEHEDKPFIVMEFVDGVSVHRLIKHRLKYGRGISLRRSLSIISQLLKALHGAHALNIVHRDIKGSNVLILNNGGRVKLADFGMARITESPDLTMIGTFIGTPRFMAPELRIGLEADARADVFSAARLFLELLKMLPKSSPIPRSRITEINNMPPGNRIDYSALYPTALIPVLTRALEVNRNKRYQTALEFMSAIKNALPNIMRQVATSSVSVAPTIYKSIPKTVVSEGELDSMKTLLTDFVGPVATIIMEEHETKSTSANNLVFEISKEIPEREMREEFIRRWVEMSVSRRAFFNMERPSNSPDQAKPRPVKREILDKIGRDFSHYVGPIAKTLLTHYSSRTRDKDQLVKYLGREIPDRKLGQKFIKSWLGKGKQFT